MSLRIRTLTSSVDDKNQLFDLIFLEDLFNSINQASFLECGHSIHKECLAKYAKTNYKCPICSKAMYDINKYIEQQVNNTPVLHFHLFTGFIFLQGKILREILMS